VTRGAGGLVRWWCALYTWAVPEEARLRRREEIGAHVLDACDGWGTGRAVRVRLAVDCARGAWDDLVWCNEVRRSEGLQNLAVDLVLGPVGASLIAGISMVAAYAFSLSDMGVFPFVREIFVAIAAGVTLASIADRTIRWRRSRHGGNRLSS
jgi:hypothetical protein